MDTLGLVECKSVAAGIACVDNMLKVADVELVRAGTICSGKYMIYISGDREAVNTSILAAEKSNIKLVGSFVISSISSEIVHILRNESLPNQPYINDIKAIGVVESFSVSAGIRAADRAIKKAHVSLGRFVLGQGISGKAYFVLYGDLASVQEAVDEAKNILANKLVEAVVIARPETAVIKTLINGVRKYEKNID